MVFEAHGTKHRDYIDVVVSFLQVKVIVRQLALLEVLDRRRQKVMVTLLDSDLQRVANAFVLPVCATSCRIRVH